MLCTTQLLKSRGGKNYAPTADRYAKDGTLIEGEWRKNPPENTFFRCKIEQVPTKPMPRKSVKSLKPTL